MLRKARAFIALIAFMTTVRCDILIYNKYKEQIDIVFKDALSKFGGEIPIEGFKVF